MIKRYPIAFHMPLVKNFFVDVKTQAFIGKPMAAPGAGGDATVLETLLMEMLAKAEASSHSENGRGCDSEG